MRRTGAVEEASSPAPRLLPCSDRSDACTFRCCEPSSALPLGDSVADECLRADRRLPKEGRCCGAARKGLGRGSRGWLLVLAGTAALRPIRASSWATCSRSETFYLKYVLADIQQGRRRQLHAAAPFLLIRMLHCGDSEPTHENGHEGSGKNRLPGSQGLQCRGSGRAQSLPILCWRRVLSCPHWLETGARLLGYVGH